MERRLAIGVLAMAAFGVSLHFGPDPATVQGTLLLTSLAVAAVLAVAWRRPGFLARPVSAGVPPPLPVSLSAGILPDRAPSWSESAFRVADAVNGAVALARVAGRGQAQPRITAAIAPDVPPVLLGRAEMFGRLLFHLLQDALRQGRGAVCLEVLRPPDAGCPGCLELVVTHAEPAPSSEGRKRRPRSSLGLQVAAGRLLALRLARGIEGELSFGDAAGGSPSALCRLQFSLPAPVSEPEGPVRVGRQALARLQGKQVVLADPERLRANVLAGTLESSGIRLRLARDALSILECLAEAVPDALILARALPDGEAETLIRDLRAAGMADTAVVVLLSGLDGTEAASCRAAGAQQTVSAGTSPDAVLAALAAALADVRRRSAANRAVRTGEQGKAVPPVLPPLPPGVDVEAALRHAAGRTEALLQALRHFRDHCGESFLRDFRAAVLTADWRRSARLAAELRTTAGHIGALQLSRTAERLEATIREHRYREVQPLLGELAEQLQRLLQGLTRID